MGKIEAYIPNVRYLSLKLHKGMLVYLLAFTENRIIAAVTNDAKEVAGLEVKNMFSFNDMNYPNKPNVGNTLISENAPKLGDFFKVDPDKLLSSDQSNFAIAYSDILKGMLIQSRNSKLTQTESRILLVTASGKSYEFMLMGMSRPSIGYQPYALDDNTFNSYAEIVNKFLGDKVKVLRASDPVPKVSTGQLFGGLFGRKKKDNQQAEATENK